MFQSFSTQHTHTEFLMQTGLTGGLCHRRGCIVVKGRKEGLTAVVGEARVEGLAKVAREALGSRREVRRQIWKLWSFSDGSQPELRAGSSSRQLVGGGYTLWTP